MVDTKKCKIEQNYLYLHGYLAITSGDAVVVLMKDQREKYEPHISKRICDNINECEKTFEKVAKLIYNVGKLKLLICGHLVNHRHVTVYSRVSTYDKFYCTDKIFTISVWKFYHHGRAKSKFKVKCDDPCATYVRCIRWKDFLLV